MTLDYSPESIAGKIVDHSYDAKVVQHKRFGEGNYGINLGLESKEDFKNHIVNTLYDKDTEFFQSTSSRDIYYNQKTNTVVVVNFQKDENGEIYGGTCYRDKCFREEYERLIRKENRDRNKIGINAVEEKIGGYSAAYPSVENTQHIAAKKDIINLQEAEDTHHHISTLPSHIKAKIAMAGLGFGMSGVTLLNAEDTGDKAIAAGNIATATAQTTTSIMEVAGKTVAPLAGKLVTGANVAVTLVDGGYQIYKEDTTDHKLQRAGAVGVTATSAGLASLVPAVAEGAIGTVAAPVVLMGGVTLAVGAATSDMVDNAHYYEAYDKQNKFSATSDYRHTQHLAFVLAPELEKFGIKPSGYGKFDLNNPENLDKLEAVIKEKQQADVAYLNENSSILPRWFQRTTSLFNEGSTIHKTDAAQVHVNLYNAVSDELHNKRDELSQANLGNARHAASQDVVVKSSQGLLTTASNEPEYMQPIINTALYKSNQSARA